MSFYGALPHIYAQNYQRQERLARGARLLGLAIGAGAAYAALSGPGYRTGSIPSGTSAWEEPSLIGNLASNSLEALDTLSLPVRAGASYLTPESPALAPPISEYAGGKDVKSGATRELSARRSQHLASNLF